MKDLLRNLLRRCGLELLHRTDDPVLAELRTLHETLRLKPGQRLQWEDTLPGPAAHASLRNLLELHRIDLLVDVGANRGQFARHARRLGFRGRIVSFEPLMRYQEELRTLAKADGNWEIVSYALGSAAAELSFHVYNDDVFSSLHAVNAAGRARFTELVAESHVEAVSVRTLDELWPKIAAGRKHRVMLKTDTQGHDLEVLSGATGVLADTFAVITEASLHPIYEGAPPFGEVCAWLESRGFAASGLFPISHRAEDLALIEMDAFFTRAGAQG